MKSIYIDDQHVLKKVHVIIFFAYLIDNIVIRYYILARNID